MKVLCYGEILWDIIEGIPYLGGAPFNGAAHFAQCGVKTYMASRLGTDHLGDRALQEAEKIGVQTSFIQRDQAYPTGTVDVFLVDGQPSYTIHEQVAYDFIDFQALLDAKIEEHRFDVFSFGTLAQRHQQSKDTLHRLLKALDFDHVFYDVNLRKNCYSLDNIRESLPHSSILKLNDEEVVVLSKMLYGTSMEEEDFCHLVAGDFGLQIIIVTAGGKGCWIFEDGKMAFVKGKKITVVDTVGAGDSFSAAFLFKYFRDGDALEAAAAANQVGAFVASSRGPIPKYSAEIKRILGLDY